MVVWWFWLVGSSVYWVLRFSFFGFFVFDVISFGFGFWVYGVLVSKKVKWREWSQRFVFIGNLSLVA